MNRQKKCWLNDAAVPIWQLIGIPNDGRVMSTNAKEAILAAARQTAQAHGYGGLNYRDLATEVGIKAASIHYHFPAKADLGAAVAKRYWEDIVGDLAAYRTQARAR